jgi:hypothetical protein
MAIFSESNPKLWDFTLLAGFQEKLNVSLVYFNNSTEYKNPPFAEV